MPRKTSAVSEASGGWKSTLRHVPQSRNRHDFGPRNEHPLAVALDAGQVGLDHVVLARRLGVAQVVQVGVAQLQVVVVQPPKFADTDKRTSEVDDHYLA